MAISILTEVYHLVCDSCLKVMIEEDCIMIENTDIQMCPTTLLICFECVNEMERLKNLRRRTR